MRRRLDVESCGTWAVAIGIIAAFWLLVLLGGCVTVQRAKPTPPPVAPRVETVTVEVPVARSCVPATLGPPPAYPDTVEALRAARDAAERLLLLAAGRTLRTARLGEVEPVVAGCR